MAEPSGLSLKDRDLAQWLDNKLGAPDDLWGSKNATPLLSKEVLDSVDSCFQELQTNVKLKLLISILYLSRRNIEQWQESIENVISLALQDTDDWVQTTAEILRDYCASNGLSLSADNELSHFSCTLASIRQIARSQSKTTPLQLLPLDACFLSKSLLSAQGIQQQRHFALKRRPKSASLRVELLNKATDLANQPKPKSGHSLSSVLPIRARTIARKMDDKSPLRGIPTVNASKSSGGFSAEKKITRPLIKREGGAKLIEISETPQALKLKRKQWEAEQRQVRAQEKEEQKRKMAELKEERKAQRLAAAAAPKAAPPNKKIKVGDVIEDGLVHQSATPDYAADIMPRAQMATVRPPMMASPMGPGPSLVRPPFSVPRPSAPSAQIRVPIPSTVIQSPANAQTPPQKTPVYSITKEVMQQAQDMFRTANKLSRPEKALILGFMAGNRENPCPQMGHVLTVRLSESREVQQRMDGTQDLMAVETFFQMNYENGEWKRLKKVRPLKPEELTALNGAQS